MSQVKPGQKPVFIPYRDSKLTRILKQSLGGNTFTSILCTVTGAEMFREETVTTLKFGQLCKSIKNRFVSCVLVCVAAFVVIFHCLYLTVHYSVKSNEVVDDRVVIKQLKVQVEELKKELALALEGMACDDEEDEVVEVPVDGSAPDVENVVLTEGAAPALAPAAGAAPTPANPKPPPVKKSGGGSIAKLQK